MIHMQVTQCRFLSCLVKETQMKFAYWTVKSAKQCNGAVAMLQADH